MIIRDVVQPVSALIRDFEDAFGWRAPITLGGLVPIMDENEAEVGAVVHLPGMAVSFLLLMAGWKARDFPGVGLYEHYAIAFEKIEKGQVARVGLHFDGERTAVELLETK